MIRRNAAAGASDDGGRLPCPRSQQISWADLAGASPESIDRSDDQIDAGDAHVTLRRAVFVDGMAAKSEMGPITNPPLKHTLHELLDQGRFEEIAEMAARRKLVLGSLVALTYDADARISWRAVEAVGAAASRIAEDHPDHVRELLRRLLWLINEESGGICWRAPEAMAEILRHRPTLFPDYIPIVTSLIVNLEEEDLEHFRAGTLRAIGRLGVAGADHVQEVIPSVASALNDSDPQVRGMAAWCLREVGRADLLEDRPDLLADEEPVDLYEDGMVIHTTVSQLVQRAVTR
jgi:HEAT repeat protein